MADAGSNIGAFDASVAAQNFTQAQLDEIQTARRELDKTLFYVEQLERMRTKLAKTESFVANANASVAAAEQELADATKRAEAAKADAARLAALSPDERAATLAAADQATAAERTKRRESEAKARAAAKAKAGN